MNKPLKYDPGVGLRDPQVGLSKWLDAMEMELPYTITCMDPTRYPVEALVKRLRERQWHIVHFRLGTREPDESVRMKVKAAIRARARHVLTGWDAISDDMGVTAKLSPRESECFIVRVEGDGMSKSLWTLHGCLMNNVWHQRQNIGVRFGDGTVGKCVLAALWLANPKQLIPGWDGGSTVAFRGMPEAPWKPPSPPMKVPTCLPQVGSDKKTTAAQTKKRA